MMRQHRLVRRHDIGSGLQCTEHQRPCRLDTAHQLGRLADSLRDRLEVPHVDVHRVGVAARGLDRVDSLLCILF